MQEVTLPIWLAVLVGLAGPIAALIGVGGVVYTQKLTNRREAERRAHERQTKQMELDHARELKRMELEDKKRERLREERMRAYIEFATITAMINVAEEFDFLDLKQALSRIELVGSSEEVVEAARTLDRDCIRARERAQEAKNAGEENPLNDATFLQEYFHPWQDSRDLFVEVARTDLTQQ